MKTNPCPNCGAPKHPLKSCPQCGFTILRQEGIEAQSKSLIQDIKDRQVQIYNDDFRVPTNAIKSGEQIRHYSGSIPTINSAPIVRTTTDSKQSATHKILSEAKKLSKKIKFQNQRKQRVRGKDQKQDFYWNCPVCHATFLSIETKNRHIKLHGVDRVASAIVEEQMSANRKPIKLKSNNICCDKPIFTGTPEKAEDIPCMDSPVIAGACRLCGKNKPMIGEDICYHCQSE